MSSSDTIMSQLLEMGFPEAQASAYSSAYASIEAALEALVRDEARQGGPPLPAGREAPQAAGSAATPTHAAAATATHSLEERKEDLSGELLPSAWTPLHLPSSSTATSTLAPSASTSSDSLFGLFGDVDEFVVAADSSLEQSEAEAEAASEAQFDVLHTSLHTPTQTGPGLAGLGARELSALFAKLQAEVKLATLHETSDSPSTADAVVESTSVSCNELSLSPIAASGDSSALSSHSSSSCATPRNNNEAENECVFCCDAPKDTLLLPCRHLPLCSSCALDYVQRTRVHNHRVQLLQLATAEEARVSRFVVSAVSKSVARVCACPTCAQPVEQALRRRKSAATTTLGM